MNKSPKLWLVHVSSPTLGLASRYRRRRLMCERLLVLSRHGESEGNAGNIFTGGLDLPLTAAGRQQAKRAAAHIRTLGLTIGYAYTSALRRTIESCRIILDELDSTDTRRVAVAALNERSYGDLAGIDRNDAVTRWGNEQVQRWRRSYEIAPPGGESLRDTVARVLPFYNGTILPAVLCGEGVLVVAHGSSLRALVMAVEQLPPAAMVRREFATGEMLIYRLKTDATVASKAGWVDREIS